MTWTDFLREALDRPGQPDQIAPNPSEHEPADGQTERLYQGFIAELDGVTESEMERALMLAKAR